MIGEWWYFSHIGAVCWGIMRDMTGYEATMLRSRSNILLTSLKDRLAAVFGRTQVSQLLTLDLPVMLCSLLVFNHTISLRFLLLSVKLSWTGGLTRWKCAVQLCAKWCSHLHGWQVRNSVRAASTLTCMGTSGTSDSTCPESFFCIASPAPKKRNWVPRENILKSVAFPRSVEKHVKKKHSKSSPIRFPETKLQFSCMKSRYVWTMFNLFILCLKSCYTNHQLMHGWNTSKSHWPQGLSMSFPIIYMAEIPMTPGHAIGSPSLIGTRPTATGMASCAALPWVPPSCACGSISQGGAGMGFGKNMLEHHEKSRIIKVFLFHAFHSNHIQWGSGAWAIGLR